MRTHDQIRELRRNAGKKGWLDLNETDDLAFVSCAPAIVDQLLAEIEELKKK